MLKLEKGPIPKYYQLEKILRNRIAAKEILPNQHLPTEMELCEEFDISRATVRQAVRALELDGVVERTPGRGTIVIPNDQKQVYTKLYGAPDKVFAPGKYYETTLISKKLVTPDQEVIADMKLGNDQKLYFFEAIRTNESQHSVSYIQMHVPKDIGAKISINKNQEKTLLFRRIEALIGEPIHKFTWQTKAVKADSTVSKNLELKKGTPILVAKRTYFSRDGRALERAISYQPGDIYQMEMELMMTGN